VGPIATEVAAVENAGYGEVNPPHMGPAPEPAAGPVPPSPVGAPTKTSASYTYNSHENCKHNHKMNLNN
ncbi:hypothetical protein MKX03_031129, partial [Papaver bracteatum]